ncbi:hypothetical protein BDQ17DRAFT_1543598 [Cyathus striatus]|nr:hypothetical protein BDQ17DRAFT_1543598 [Cyathus striatus]
MRGRAWCTYRPQYRSRQCHGTARRNVAHILCSVLYGVGSDDPTVSDRPVPLCEKGSAMSVTRRFSLGTVPRIKPPCSPGTHNSMAIFRSKSSLSSYFHSSSSFLFILFRIAVFNELL